MMLATLYGRTKHNKEAIPLYRKILELTGDNPGIKRQLASSMVEAEQYDDAVEVLKDLTSAPHPATGKPGSCSGARRSARGSYDRGHRTVQVSARGLVRGDLEAEFYLATAYEQSGKAQGGRPTFSPDCSRAPTVPKSRRRTAPCSSSTSPPCTRTWASTKRRSRFTRRC